MKKIISIFVVAVIALCMGTEAKAQLSNLSFGDYKVKRVMPRGFTSADGTVLLQVVNSGAKFTITEISGMVYKDGTAFMTGTADDVTFVGGPSSVAVTGHASLVSMSALLSIITHPTIDPERYSVDVKAKIVQGDKTRIIDVKDIPLSKLLD